MRKYTGDPIPESVLTVLREKIDEVNRIGNLHVQMVTDEPKSFSGLMAYGAFSGVNQGNSHKIKARGDVSNVSDLTPAWFNKGVDAALLAPTAVNQQKFYFEYLGKKGDGKPWA